MPTITRILCPVDFGGGSRKAMDHAKALAAQHGAGLTVLHVIGATAAQTAEDEVLARLRELVGGDAVGGRDVDVRCVRGDAARRIVEVASAMEADVIVMAPRAEPVLERAPLGSVTQAVLVAASCPVLVLSAFAVSPRAPLSQILCPLDFAAVDATLVEYAGSLAASSRARLTLLHIVDRREELAAGTEASGATDELERQALRRLEEAAEPARATGVHVDCQVDVGVASREILFAARAIPADLIVMGAQSRSGFELLQLGSTTHDVMCEALCPVIVMRAPRVSRPA